MPKRHVRCRLGPFPSSSPSRLVSFVPGLFLVIVVVVAVVVAVVVVVFVVVVWCVCFGGGSRVVTLCDSTRHGCEHCWGVTCDVWLICCTYFTSFTNPVWYSGYGGLIIYLRSWVQTQVYAFYLNILFKYIKYIIIIIVKWNKIDCARTVLGLSEDYPNLVLGLRPNLVLES